MSFRCEVHLGSVGLYRGCRVLPRSWKVFEKRDRTHPCTGWRWMCQSPAGELLAQIAFLDRAGQAQDGHFAGRACTSTWGLGAGRAEPEDLCHVIQKYSFQFRSLLLGLFCESNLVTKDFKNTCQWDLSNLNTASKELLCTTVMWSDLTLTF